MTITDGLHSHAPLDRPRRPPALRGPRARTAAARHRLADGRRGLRPAGRRAGRATTPSSPTTRAAMAGSTIDDPDEDATARTARRRRRRDPRRARRRVGRRVRLQRRRGDGAGAGRPASRPGAHARRPRAAVAGTAARRRSSSGPPPRTSSRRSTATGLEAAWCKFMVNAGFDMTTPADGAPPGPEPTAASRTSARPTARFFDHECAPRSRTVPDIAALKAGPTRVVVGIGADSGQLLTYRTSRRAGRAARHARQSSSPAITADSSARQGEFADTRCAGRGDCAARSSADQDGVARLDHVVDDAPAARRTG